MYDQWKKSQYIQVYLNAFSSIILENGWNLKFSSIIKYQFFFQVFSSIFQFFQYEWPPCANSPKSIEFIHLKFIMSARLKLWKNLA